MHLITALHLQKPSLITKLGVVGAQGNCVCIYGTGCVQGVCVGGGGGGGGGGGVMFQ